MYYLIALKLNENYTVLAVTVRRHLLTLLPLAKLAS